MFGHAHIPSMTKETPDNQSPPEERLRREAAERLNAMMARSMRLLDDCAMLAATGKTDPAGAVTATARLLKSNADVTHALVYAVQGETRHRSIVETINGGSRGLNSNFFGSPRVTKEKAEELRKSITLKINRLLENQERADDLATPEDESGRDTSTDDSATKQRRRAEGQSEPAGSWPLHARGARIPGACACASARGA